MKQRRSVFPLLKGLSERRMLALLAIVFVCAGTVLTWAFLPERHHIRVYGLSKAIVFSTTARDVVSALRAGGVELGPQDRVSPPLNTPLKGREVAVQINKALPVTVVADGRTIETQSAAATVRELLKELAIQLRPQDSVDTDLAAELTAGMQVKVVRRTQTVVVSRVEIPFDTVRREDPTLDQGQTRELQAGESGIREVSQVTYLEDGKPVKTAVLTDVVVKDPTARIVAYGTVGVVFRGGESYRYVKELDLSATGYTAGKESNPNGTGNTYIGMKAEHGVVAVDPDVIPLYSRLYIEGYGPAIAADIGGAIQGERIDLCFDTVQEALDWGRRTVKVYVLSD